MNTVIYAREYKSPKNDISIERQLETCLKYAIDHNLKILGTYIDKGENRTEFLQIMEDSIDETFDTILVYEPSIFANNRYDSIIYMNQLKQHNITLLSTIDCTTTEDILQFLQIVIEALSEHLQNEQVQIAERSHNNGKI